MSTTLENVQREVAETGVAITALADATNNLVGLAQALKARVDELIAAGNVDPQLAALAAQLDAGQQQAQAAIDAANAALAANAPPAP